MENATKALIIAASILIAIVLITLGVFVLGQGTTMVKENSDMTAEQVTAYNAKWEPFLGTKVSGSKVKQLIRTQIQAKKIDSSKAPTLDGITTEGDINTVKTYSVTPTYDDKSGVISNINIGIGE